VAEASVDATPLTKFVTGIRVGWHRTGPAKTLTAAPPTSRE
jgi:hypothetical protein